MPKVTITLQDATTPEGKPFCRVNFKMDREGYPVNAPATAALMNAAAIRIIGDLGIIDKIMPLIETKTQFDELTNYLRNVGALSDTGELNIVPVSKVGPAKAANDVEIAKVEDLEVIDGVAVPADAEKAS